MNGRTIGVLIVFLAGVIAGMSCNTTARSAQQAEAVTRVDERSYSVGFEIGSQAASRLASDGVSLSDADMVRGFADAVAARQPAIAQRRMLAVLAELEREVRGRQAAQRMQTDPVFRALAVQNLERSRRFHASFGERPGVETLPSGVQRRVITAGQGARVEDDDTVTVTFVATLVDGHVFGEGREETVIVSEMVPGLRAMLLSMREGDHWYLAVPPDRAFGLGGRDPDIGPNETLLIDVRVIDVQDAAP